MLAVLFHDDRLLVLDKPPGLLSVPGLGPSNQDCLASRAAECYPGARIVHRLDRETSGVIVLAMDAEAHRSLGRQFEQRRTLKSYLAVVAGTPPRTLGAIDLPLRKDLDRPPRHRVDPVAGRPALTRYAVIERRDGRSLLELHPVTGRSHQLRVHLAAIGHPILGDDLYAPAPVAAMAGRLMLHAASLSVAHPATGERLTFEAPCAF